MLRVFLVTALAVLTWAWETGGDPLPPRIDTSRAELASLGQEYHELRQWATAIAQATDTLSDASSERARVLAGQLVRLMSPLEDDFARTTAALSTDELDLVLPLWERMAFAHAGFVMLRDEAEALGGDLALDPAELHDLVAQLSAVLDFAMEIQQMVLDQLTAPPESPVQIT
jgi:hypothetical protein